MRVGKIAHPHIVKRLCINKLGVTYFPDECIII